MPKADALGERLPHSMGAEHLLVQLGGVLLHLGHVTTFAGSVNGLPRVVP